MYFTPSRAINGVKEMDGFREAFNISQEHRENASSSCSGDDNVETSALIVRIVCTESMLGAWMICMYEGDVVHIYIEPRQ